MFDAAKYGEACLDAAKLLRKAHEKYAKACHKAFLECGGSSKTHHVGAIIMHGMGDPGFDYAVAFAMAHAKSLNGEEKEARNDDPAK